MLGIRSARRPTSTACVDLESVEPLEFVMETVRQTRAGLARGTAADRLRRGPVHPGRLCRSKADRAATIALTKTLMYGDAGAWDALMGRLARAIARYLNAQIGAGAQVVQLFDSWVGCLGEDDYRRYVLPYSRAVIEGLRPGVPVIHFATGNPALLPALSEAGGDVIGVDWRIRLDDAWRQIGHDRAVQGNLDPIVLLTTPEEVRRRAAEVLAQAGGRAGHIFNLGHGVLPQTPVENVLALVEAVHESPGENHSAA